ncbi:MAG: serine/threonine protein kinase [Clostridiales bacterium]|nr:serine/threonine protein kinase [Clostridiales bacterium]
MSHDSYEPERGSMNREGFCLYCMSRVAPGETCPHCGLTQGAYTPAPHHLPPGTVLAGRYLVGRVLGEGGFGITYIGCDLRLEMKVAIKEYFPADQVSRFSSNSLAVLVRTGSGAREYNNGLNRFLREARVMARMEKQPQIVLVRDFFEANNTAYIVMEYVEGTNFLELVEQRGGRIPARELLPLIEPLFSALTALHEAGLIHRDISPDNLMLERGTIRLLDLGCARESARNKTMTIALKQGYAPIEQYQQKGQGPWTDVYALSATIYYCLTGRVPPQALDRILEDELIPPRDLGVDLTPGQQKALLRGMAIQPRRRYQSVEELHAGLYRPVEPEPEPEPDPVPVPVVEPKTEAGPSHKPDNGKLRRIAAAVVAAALVVAIAAIALVPKNGETVPDPTPDTSETVAVSRTVDDTDGDTAKETELVGSEVTVASLFRFQEALENDNVTTITLVGNITWETENGILEINKTVYIEEGVGLLSCHAVVVGEGGSVEIASGGSLEAEIALIQTKDGGSITVKDGGSLSAWKLWVEQEDDLTLEDGASINEYGNDSWDEIKADNMLYIVLSEEELFADATPVTTWDELQAALEDGSTQAVKVTSGSEITVTEWFVAQVPVLIEEGAVVTAAEDGAWGLRDTVLVNRGTMTCDLPLEDGESGSVIVNYGTITGRLSGCSWSVFLNVGQMNLRGGGALQCTDLVNLGTINAVGEGEDVDFYFRENNLMNFGVWTLEGQNMADGEQASLTSVGSFVNWGTLEIGADASLENYNYMYNYGSINLTEASSTLQNEGILNAYNGQINAAADSLLVGSGLITYSVPDALPLSENISEALYLVNETGDGLTWVSNLEELESALANDEVDRVVLDGEDVTVSGDLTVNKLLLLNCSLTVEGSLTVTGEDAYLYGAVNADSLTVSDGAVAALNGGCTFGSVTVEGSTVYTGYLESEASLTLESSLLVAYDELYLANAEVTLENSQMYVWQDLGLENCNVTIDNSSAMTHGYDNLTLSGDSTLTNYGTFYERSDHWLYTCTLDGTVTNYGIMYLDAVITLNLNGTLNNYGILYGYVAPDSDNGLKIYGSLNNQGTFYLDGGTLTDVLRDDGIYSGNDPE